MKLKKLFISSLFVRQIKTLIKEIMFHLNFKSLTLKTVLNWFLKFFEFIFQFNKGVSATMFSSDYRLFKFIEETFKIYLIPPLTPIVMTQ